MTTQTQDRPPTPDSGASADDRAFLGHPKGLSTLFFVELWERFSYYGMRAILLYFLIDTVANGGLGIDETTGTAVVAIYGASVYLLSIIGGFTADRLFGARRSPPGPAPRPCPGPRCPPPHAPLGGRAAGPRCRRRQSLSWWNRL